MTREVFETLTPSLIQLGEEIVKYTQEGFRIKRGPELLGWQYYCEFVMDAPEVVPVAEAPKRGPKPKVKAEVKEPVGA